MSHRVARPYSAVTRSVAPGGSWLAASRSRFALVAIVFLTVLVSSSMGLLASEADAAIACDKYAAVNGSDRAKGTSAAPFRTAQKLVDSLAAGQVGCLRAGTYAGDKNLFVRKAGITLTSAPNQRATIKSRVTVQQGSNGVTVSGLRLEGSRGLLDVLV